MIRAGTASDFTTTLAVINDGANAYRNVIPADRLSEPYMSAEELQSELNAGVQFFVWEESRGVLGVLGLQYVKDVTLIRHAYVRTAEQGKGIGGRLLEHVRPLARGPILLGTWADSYWALSFYKRHGFRMVGPQEKEVLLRRYWHIPDRQVDTSVVFVDHTWHSPGE